MVEIDNYQDSSPDESDNVESSEGERDREESSKDTNRDEEDPLSLPICARDISGELYDLATWLDEVGSFPAKISIRSRMTVYHDFRKILVEQKLCNKFKGTCFGHLRHILDYLKFNGQIVHYMLLRRFALITGLNCSAYSRESKLNKVLRKGENFHFKVTRNKNITGAKLMRKIKSNKLNNEQKLKCSFVWFDHSMLLAHDRSKIVDSNHIKMTDGLDFFNSYPLGKESFDLTFTYLKNRINLRKQGKMYNEKKNACYALYGFSWTFLVWIYEAFPYLGKYVRKSLDTPLPIPQSTDDEYLGDHNIVQPCVNYVSSKQKNAPSTNNGNLENLSERVLSLEQSIVDVVAYVREERLRRIEKNKKTQQKKGAVDPMAANVIDEVASDEVAVDVVDEVAGDTIDEVAEEKKEEEKVKEKSVDNGEEEEEDDSVENSMDVMSIVMELNGEINGDEKTIQVVFEVLTF
ncbi:hypothetical protein R3W88_024248 [Solanum pinnatisectum]|uniref:DUF1985 domain-containing protein n=1 Tax=Solanum pinnatisectum TaxID=50273 RepID=A0AAV9LZR2_9SOLN|nr:hypothetical protein R3W88_024248 [Solanum pinnatisectum]